MTISLLYDTRNVYEQSRDKAEHSRLGRRPASGYIVAAALIMYLRQKDPLPPPCVGAVDGGREMAGRRGEGTMAG